MDNNIKTNKAKSYSPLDYFSVIIVLFSLIFTRLLIKMDDGHFLGIAMAPDFTYLGFLKERYYNLSGRTVGEFLVMFFLRHNFIWYQLCNSAMIIYIVWFWCKLSDKFSGQIQQRNRHIFCCCAMFLMIISCLNPSVFWFAGSFSYLWPFTGILLTISPLVFYIFDNKLNNKMLVASFFGTFLGTAQEQACASTIALYILLTVIIIIKKSNFKLRLLIPILPITICSYFLFSAPGIKGRTAMEATSGFPAFFEMSVFEKLFAGLCVFIANIFYLSNFLILLFIAFLSVMLYTLSKNKALAKKLLITANAFSVFVCVILNYSVAASAHSMPHMIFRSAFISGEFNIYSIILITFGILLLVMLLGMTIILTVKDKKAGFAVLICCAAGFGCAMALSFSPTMFKSGQRIFFFTNMFIVTACAILISRVPNSRTSRFLLKSSVVYGSLTFLVDLFAFSFIELPLMG